MQERIFSFAKPETKAFRLDQEGHADPGHQRVLQSHDKLFCAAMRGTDPNAFWSPGGETRLNTSFDGSPILLFDFARLSTRAIFAESL